jgi:uncharacterized protein YegJ (DUF2314 family)
MLLLKPRFLDAPMLARLASKALGVEISAQDVEKRTAFVTGRAPCFVLRVFGRLLLVNNFPIPYFEQPGEILADVHELRLRKAVQDHRAWLSVDALSDVSEQDMEEVYGMLGKLVATLAMSDCLAVYAPAIGGLCVYEPNLIELLAGPNPVSAFQRVASDPAYASHGDNPAPVEGIEEARRRWPEFVAAFERRRPGQVFFVKAPIGDATHTEYMWVRVSNIGPDFIDGVVDNDSVELMRVHVGDTVRVNLADMNDWVYVDGETRHGGLTVAATQAGHMSGGQTRRVDGGDGVD